MSLADTPDLHAGQVRLDAADLRPGDQLVWTQTDGARVLVQVTRINRDAGIAYLHCHYAGRSWTRRQDLPLWPSMKRASWTNRRAAGDGSSDPPRPSADPAVIQLVAAHHRAALIALSHEWKGDPNGCAGLAWGVRALDRTLLACDGETDAVKLGLAAAPPEPVEQDGLFTEPRKP